MEIDVWRCRMRACSEEGNLGEPEGCVAEGHRFRWGRLCLRIKCAVQY
jgi:hypothetical protein